MLTVSSLCSHDAARDCIDLHRSVLTPLAGNGNGGKLYVYKMNSGFWSQVKNAGSVISLPPVYTPIIMHTTHTIHLPYMCSRGFMQCLICGCVSVWVTVFSTVICNRWAIKTVYYFTFKWQISCFNYLFASHGGIQVRVWVIAFQCKAGIVLARLHGVVGHLRIQNSLLSLPSLHLIPDIPFLHFPIPVTAMPSMPTGSTCLYLKSVIQST